MNRGNKIFPILLLLVLSIQLYNVIVLPEGNQSTAISQGNLISNESVLTSSIDYTKTTQYDITPQWTHDTEE